MTVPDEEIARLKQKYISLGQDVKPVAPEQLANIETALGVVLPKDFVAISKFFRGGGVLGATEHNSISDSTDEYYLLGDTLKWRRGVNLDPQAIVLEDTYIDSVILLFCDREPAVVWCSYYSEFSRENIDLDIEMSWKNYADFFAWMLEEEEKEQEYNRSNEADRTA